jgi:RimJ/RimL family protein N-acetyltransferase
VTLSWPSAPPVLGGALVTLRPWRSSDRDAVFTACQDPDIQRWTTVPSPYLHEHAAGFVDGYAKEQWVTRRGTPFCIASTGDDEVLGSCDVFSIDTKNLVAEMGYWVAPWARGQGVASQAVGILSGWAMGDIGLGRLELLIRPDNAASRAVAERAGGVFEGILRGKVLDKGERIDMALYALVR